MCDFQARTKSVSPVRAMFAAREYESLDWPVRSVAYYTPISLVIVVAKSIKRALLIHELEGWRSFVNYLNCKVLAFLPLNESPF
jgi:hypothetical protein